MFLINSMNRNNKQRMGRLAPDVLALFFFLMCYCQYVTATSLPVRSQVLRPAPDFVLQDMQGKAHDFSSYAGKTVVVNFWAVWCAPCRREIPAMNRAWKKLKNENIAMLAVNVGDELSAIKEFNKKYPIDFTVLQDKNGAVSQHWQVAGFPTTFIINPAGKIVYRVVGGREWDEESMLESIRSVTAN